VLFVIVKERSSKDNQLAVSFSHISKFYQDAKSLGWQ
jgi:hypothetical protein